MTTKEVPDYDRGKAKRYANQRYILTGLTSLYWFAFLLLFLVTGASAALKEAAFGVAGAGSGGQSIYLLGFILISAVALLPLGYYQGYVVEHRFEPMAHPVDVDHVRFDVLIERRRVFPDAG